MNKKKEQHLRSFQNPLNVPLATDHMIHQNTNLDHAMDVTQFFTAEENVKRKIGSCSIMDTRRVAKNYNYKYKKIRGMDNNKNQ